KTMHISVARGGGWTASDRRPPFTYARRPRRRLRPRRPWGMSPGMAGSHAPPLRGADSRGADSRSAAAKPRFVLETVLREWESPPALQRRRCEAGRATLRWSRTAPRAGLTEGRRGLERCRTDPEEIQTMPVLGRRRVVDIPPIRRSAAREAGRT